VQANVGVDTLPLLRNPNVVSMPAASAAFQDRFFTVTAEPLTLSVPFQSWVMVWPLASVQGGVVDHRSCTTAIGQWPRCSSA